MAAVHNAYEAIKAAFPAATLVMSDDIEQYDDEIELGDGAAVQVCIGPRGDIGFFAKFSTGEADEFAMWDEGKEHKDAVAAANAAIALRAAVLAKIGGDQ